MNDKDLLSSEMVLNVSFEIEKKILCFQNSRQIALNSNGNGTNKSVVSLHFIRFQNGHKRLFGT